MRKDLALELRGGPGQWEAPAPHVSWGLSADEEPAALCCGGGSLPIPQMGGWMDPSLMLDPPDGPGVTGMPPGQPWHRLLLGWERGSVPCGRSAWNPRSQGEPRGPHAGGRHGGASVGSAQQAGGRGGFYTMYVQMQRIKGNGSDSSGLSPWGVRRVGTRLFAL